MSSSFENLKSARIVEIFNPDGTITTCPSIYSATKLLGKKSGTSVYLAIARGKGRIVDVRVPVWVVNEDGTRSTYRSIDKAAKTLGVTTTMEVYTMVTTGKANFGIPTREILTTPIRRRRGLRTRCVVETLNEDGTVDRTFNSITGAARALTNGYTHVDPISIYIMVALGKARLIYRAKEGEEEEGEEEGEGEGEEKGGEEEGGGEARNYCELYKEKEKEVRYLRFELLLVNTREMVHTGIFSEALKSSQETDV